MPYYPILNPHGRISRRGEPRSKSGCKTCRQRHLKCDEKRPECGRCQISGWSCDYKLKPSSTSTSSQKPKFSFRTEPVPVARTSPKPHSHLTSFSFFDGTHEEHRLFYLFTSQNNHMIQGFGPQWARSFWCLHIPQIASSEKAIKHGIIALARMHEDHTSKISITELKNNKFVLEQYNKAISIMRKKKADKETMQVTLITCIVFACLELMRGNPVVADWHFRSGLRVLGAYRQLHESSSAISTVSWFISPDYPSLQNAIASSIVYLLGGVMFFLMGPQSHDPLKIAALDTSDPPNFTSMFEAKNSLDLLLNQVFMNQCPLDANIDINPHLITARNIKRATLPIQLDEWTSKMRFFIQANRKALTAESIKMIKILETQSIVMKIWCDLMATRGQMVFDKHIENFKVILEICREVVRDQTIPYPTASSTSSSAALPSSSQTPFLYQSLPATHKTHSKHEICLIFSLIFVGFKCRSPSLRRAALSLITQVQVQLQTKDDPLFTYHAAKYRRVVEYVIDFEEKQCLAPVTEDPATWPQEHQRIHMSYLLPFQELADDGGGSTQSLIFLWEPRGSGKGWESWVEKLMF